MGEFVKRLGGIHTKQYVSLFGLAPEQEEYFNEKNVLTNTQHGVFRRVVRGAELNYIAPETGVTVSALRIDYAGGSLIYGYVHSFGKPHVPQMYCLSGHMISQDGEYRKDLVPVRQREATMRLFSEPVTMITEHIRELADADKINLSIEHYGAEVDLGTLPLFILALGWFIDKIFLNMKIVDKHLFGARTRLIEEFPGGDELFSKVLAIDGLQKFQLVATAKYPDGQNASMNAGQKLIPLPSLALASPYDVTFAVWREIYVNEMVSMLIMNNVCTGFAYTSGWFYVTGANERLFDGEQQRKKYQNSVTAREIRTDVANARSKTIQPDATYPVDDPRHDIQSPINNQFAMLHDIITGAMKFTDAHLIMSSYAICMMSVHTNVTVSNAAMLARAYSSMNIMSAQSFGRILFDHLYALYCLNTRVNAMHTDLHISNATIMRLNMDATTYDNTAYVIGDDIYSMPYSGMVGCVIDFSRAVIADTERLSREYTPQYAASVQTAQSQLLADLIRRHFPAVHSQYGTRVRLLAEDHFDAFFRVCTVIDAYSLACGVAVMFKTQVEYQTSKYAKVPQELIDLVQRIIDTSRDLFLRNMESLMRDPIAAASELRAKAPMRELIETVYGDKRIKWPPPEDEPVSHVVNSNNELKYNSKDLNPLVDPTLEAKVREEIGIARPEHSTDTRKYVASVAEFNRAAVRRIADEVRPTDYETEYVRKKTGGTGGSGGTRARACPCACASTASTASSATTNACFCYGGCVCRDDECAEKNTISHTADDVEINGAGSAGSADTASDEELITYAHVLL